MKIEIHPFTLEREKLPDHNFLDTHTKVSFEKDILVKEAIAKEEGNKLADQISNSIFSRNSKKKKLIKKLRNLDLNFDYVSISINKDINSRLKKFQDQLDNIKEDRTRLLNQIECDNIRTRQSLKKLYLHNKSKHLFEIR